MDDPIPTFSYLVSRIVERHPNLAYLHVTEPRVAGSVERDVQEGEVRYPIPIPIGAWN